MTLLSESGFSSKISELDIVGLAGIGLAMAGRGTSRTLLRKMMEPKEALRKSLVEVELERIADPLLALAEPCIGINTTPSSDDSITIGASKFGGCPDVPVGFKWPHWNDDPLSFLGQIDLSSLAGNPIAVSLPDSGLLTFFYDAEQSTWGFDPNDRGSWKVELFANNDLVRTDIPEAVFEDARFTACELKTFDMLSLPGWESPEVEALKLSDDESDQYCEFDEMEAQGLGDIEGYHRLFGHPDAVQGEMKSECQLASNGIDCGGSIEVDESRLEELSAGIADWILLLQIGSDDNLDWMWGDCGTLFFWIKKQDLEAQRFDQVWMVLQCG